MARNTLANWRALRAPDTQVAGDTEIFSVELDEALAGTVRELARQQQRSPEGQLRWLALAGLEAARRQASPWQRPGKQPYTERLAAMRPVFAELYQLHLRRGRPSGRDIERAAGRQVGHAAVSSVLAGTRVPSWAMLSSIVRALDGDLEAFLALWIKCASPDLARDEA
jgi:hypothetical protein